MLKNILSYVKISNIYNLIIQWQIIYVIYFNPDIIDNKFASIKDIIKQNNLFSDNQENKKNRPSLVKMNKIVKNYGIVNQTVIDPYSSGEESDMEDEKMNEATMKDFYNTIFDYNTIMILVFIFNLEK